MTAINPGLLKGLPLQILIILLILGLSAQTPLWRQWENKLFDVLTVVTAPEHLRPPIIIVGIDDPSFAELQMQWPWPRGVHGFLTEQLHLAGAAVVAFDVVFADPSDQEQDQLFASAIESADNVVLAADYVIQERAQYEQAIRVDPLQMFLDAGAESGISSITVDHDVVVRRFPGSPEALWRAIINAWQDATGNKQSAKIPEPGAMIRYLGADHSFEYVSYYQALNWREMLPADIFKDKIVLVGLDMRASPDPGRSQADTFATPFLSVTGWLTPGVELEATFVANALLGRSITEAPPYAIWLAILASLLLAAPAMRSWHPVKSLLATLIICALTMAGATWIFGSLDIWLPALSSLSAPPLLLAIRGGSSYLDERRKRRQIRRAFEHYVAPVVVEEMTANPEMLKLGGSRRELTLMFTDLAGFTSLSERMEPEEVANILNRHLTAMTRIILENGGTIDKFIGDAIMAFWGAPLDDDQQALRACSTAIEMQKEMDVLRDEFASEGLPPVHMRVGLHSGEAIVGNMGSHDRFDYSALGDSVNLAARLEGINKLYGTNILLSEATRNKLEGELDVIPVDRVRVKGKTEPINVYTFDGSAERRKLIESATRAYLSCRWQEAEVHWQQLLADETTAGIARVHLDRIRKFKHNSPPADWDGSVALDKM